MMRVKLVFIIIASFVFIQSDLPAYYLYNGDGKVRKFNELVKKASKADVILFGELHNNPISHWLQLELTKALYEIKKEKLILGAEMFESDQQLILDEYLQGMVTDRNFENEARLWNNYKTDYKPLLLFAKDKGLNFIATNIPRRYASFVARHGQDSLNQILTHEARKYIAPLPFNFDPELPGYRSMMHEGGGNMKYLPDAQAIKDATMAWFIIRNLKEGYSFIHFHGTYHSNNYEGIYWYLNQYKPGLKIITIATIEEEEIQKFDDANKGLADFIISVDKDMTKTY